MSRSTGTDLYVGDGLVFHDVLVDKLVYEPATKLAAVVLAHGVGFVHVDSGEKTQVTSTSRTQRCRFTCSIRRRAAARS